MTMLCHPDFVIGARVTIEKTNSRLDGCQGEIIGFTSQHPLVNFYVILLDEPYLPEGFEGKPWRGLTLIGSCLKSVAQEDLPSNDWTPENLLKALQSGTREDKRRAMVMAGILDEEGNVIEMGWKDKVTRTPMAEPRPKKGRASK